MVYFDRHADRHRRHLEPVPARDPAPALGRRRTVVGRDRAPFPRDVAIDLPQPEGPARGRPGRGEPTGNAAVVPRRPCSAAPARGAAPSDVGEQARSPRRARGNGAARGATRMTDRAERVVEVQRRAKASPEIVFSYLTDPAKHEQWQGDEAVLDPRPGGTYALRFTNGWIKGEFVEVDPPKRLVLTWGVEGAGPVSDDIEQLRPSSTTV